MATANRGQFRKGGKPWNYGLVGVIVSTRKGKKLLPLSEVTKKKISLANIGHHRNGWKLSENTKLKISLGNKGKLRQGHIAWNKGKKSPETSGINNGKWIQDRTKIIGRHNRNMHDSEYKQWRKNVCNRDGWKCKINNLDCKGRLEVHHILGWKEHSNLRYEVNNGITLCHFHHPRKRNDEIKLSPSFQYLVKTKM